MRALQKSRTRFFVCFTALYTVGQAKNILHLAGTRWKLDKSPPLRRFETPGDHPE
jgi:hypothetical protein